MSSRKPCGYCGANIVRFHSGRKYTANMPAAAMTSIPRGRKPIGRCRNRVDRSVKLGMGVFQLGSDARRRRRTQRGRAELTGFDDEVALHLLMQRRTEIGAVVGIHAL